ncbi:MAG: exodeoxyribonuclease III [Candidatus Taylorbacteria bacterium RIFCSPLOWO2_01_FULL_44_26]|uniref:Exodeoxyribonuclease III n=2 Tax=Candidatus Tayloriibacteriota TaxID=1817919 RepID=A0A1G2ML39_9BACT|nr:MAG: exodeoxyribonuclease III [Candidatus Taylorbacteria bacterium RIFCSPHIGHO2_02_FULL_44_12]OHA31157.1 MAG: exodeoxyribonuclease III [Candidatus Taylorbacteria bacterium RIFCSPLOWO2_01_FULL_44_26]
MRIISWNVNGLRANIKKGGFDWFLNESPDIYCLQETKAHPDQLEEGARNPPGYFSYFDHSRGRKGYSGVGVYSKVKPEKVDYFLGIEDVDQEGRFLALFFKEKTFSNLAKLVVINTYFPNGGGGPDRLAFKLKYYDEFLKYINKLRQNGYEIIFCGDINTAHTPIDLARPKENEKNTGFLPIERAWLDLVLKEGYVDVFRRFYPGATGKYTYWDMKTFARERNVGWRIDYFFISPGILKNVKEVLILDHILGSDHCPIELVLKF